MPIRAVTLQQHLLDPGFALSQLRSRHLVWLSDSLERHRSPNGVAAHRRNFLPRPKAPNAYQDGAKNEQSNALVAFGLCYTHRVCRL